MYRRPAFDIDDLPTLHGFIERYGFATVVTSTPGGPFASHLPLLLDRTRGRCGTLVGHFAAANPHSSLDFSREPSLAIFHGPHAYVSPGWYLTDEPHVPTWNYAVVHAYGRPNPIYDPARAQALLERMVQTYESRLPRPWLYDTTDPHRRKLLGAIIAFEVPIDRLEGKFKLSQNRKPEDRVGAAEGLESTGDVASAAVAAMMREGLDTNR